MSKKIIQLDENRFLLPKDQNPGMLIDGLIYANSQLIEQIKRDQTLSQVINVACLPGMLWRSLAMPDAHQGYGFCIGGVAASDTDSGLVSAGGVGFDINCGVRLLRSNMELDFAKEYVSHLTKELHKNIPTGVGKGGSISLGKNSLSDLLIDGAGFAVKNGYGKKSDLDFIEDRGKLPGANPDNVSKRAFERGSNQVGTLGSGNHFIEIQAVEQIYEPETAQTFGLYKNQIVILIHTGSRGLGHQVCTDHLESMNRAMNKYNIHIKDRQLASVPISSDEGKAYLSAMVASANYAFANRQYLTMFIREVLEKVIGHNSRLDIVYDVAHNIAKFENHQIEDKNMKVLVHRKGATRAFPKHHPALPGSYKEAGQPVLIPGSMGTASYVLVGTDTAMQESFGSVCHGAGRVLSRNQAKKSITFDKAINMMKEKNIEVQCTSRKGLLEEVPQAYKDVDTVVNVVHNAGLARKVAKLRPLGVIKG